VFEHYVLHLFKVTSLISMSVRAHTSITRDRLRRLVLVFV
jgi:hypothetical protein